MVHLQRRLVGLLRWFPLSVLWLLDAVLLADVLPHLLALVLLLVLLLPPLLVVRFLRLLPELKPQINEIKNYWRSSFKKTLLGGNKIMFAQIVYLLKYKYFKSWHCWDFVSFEISCHLRFRVIWDFVSFEISCHLRFRVIWDFIWSGLPRSIWICFRSA